VKRGGKFSEVLERSWDGKPLHLEKGVDLEFALLECAREALANKRLPSDAALEVLLALIDNHMLRGREGRLESWPDDERQRDLLCAKHLLDVGKEAYCLTLGLQRLRNTRAELQLRRHAVHLLVQHRPQSKIKRSDLYRFKAVPRADLIAYVDEHMPGAVAEMQAYARSLAGRSRARAQHPEGGTLLR
jgi:hypothetical protein